MPSRGCGSVIARAVFSAVLVALAAVALALSSERGRELVATADFELALRGWREGARARALSGPLLRFGMSGDRTSQCFPVFGRLKPFWVKAMILIQKT